MKTTCGIFIISNGHLLLVHAANSRANTWSIPKGVRDNSDRSDLDTALREVEEETGLDIITLIDDINEIKDIGVQVYKTDRKMLHAYLIDLEKDITDTKLICKSVFITKQNKELPEIDKWKWIDLSDWDKFYDIHEAQMIVYNRYIENLKK